PCPPHDGEFFDLHALPPPRPAACPRLRIGEFYPSEIGGVKVGREAASVYTYPFNMTGQPAATVPCGFTKAGLPIGLHIVGRRHDDVTVVRASAGVEAAHQWGE